jgi:ATP/maltotriose-dependent transcriptional regulator MalT
MSASESSHEKRAVQAAQKERRSPKAEREVAILEAARRMLQNRPVLVALLDSPGIRDVTVGELMDVLGRLSEPFPPSDMRARLSERELEVVGLIVEGLSNKQISDRLALSDKTVKNHISHILAKLSLTARTQVAVRALRDGLA